MVGGLALFVAVAGVSVFAFVHHTWRAVRTLEVPSGLRSAGADAWIGGLTGVAWLVAVTVVLGVGPAQARPVGWEAALLLVTTGAMAIYAVKLVPYAFARTVEASAVQREIAGLGAGAIELVVSAHRAQQRPAIARTTLVAVVGAGGRVARFPIAWAERAAAVTLVGCVDPELAHVAGATGLPVRVVRDERALAPMLGAPVPP